MTQFYKRNGKIFRLILLLTSSVLLIVALVYSSRFHYADIVLGNEDSLHFREMLFRSNDLLLYLSTLTFVIIVLFSIINVYKRRIFQRQHLFIGLVGIIIPLILVVFSLMQNFYVSSLLAEENARLLDYHTNRDFPVSQAGTMERDYTTFRITTVTLIIFAVSLLANAFYFIMRYKIETKNPQVMTKEGN